MKIEKASQLKHTMTVQCIAYHSTVFSLRQFIVLVHKGDNTCILMVYFLIDNFFWDLLACIHQRHATRNSNHSKSLKITQNHSSTSVSVFMKEMLFTVQVVNVYSKEYIANLGEAVFAYRRSHSPAPLCAFYRLDIRIWSNCAFFMGPSVWYVFYFQLGIHISFVKLEKIEKMPCIIIIICSQNRCLFVLRHMECNCLRDSL